MHLNSKIAPCLWFDDQAEAAAKFYVGIFRDSKIVKVTRYGHAGSDTHKRPPGSVMTVAFELFGQPFTALNGGPIFTFTEAISLQVPCATQDEIDDYWNKLSEGGDPASHICGWLKDKYGVSWQIVPAELPDLVGDPESEGSQRAMTAMLAMQKIDIAALRSAYVGVEMVPLPV